MSLPLWTPSPARIASAEVTAFAAAVNARYGLALAGYRDLHRWSIEQPGPFWRLVFERYGLVGETGAVDVADGDRMPGARFFPEGRVNYAENLLAPWIAAPEREAILFRAEDKASRRMTGGELVGLVSRLQQALAAAGVGPGDRVAAMLPNMPEGLAGLLAVSASGAVWSSCSPDFGVRGVIDRFGQIEPKVLLVADGYWYAGKEIDIAQKLAEIVSLLPTVDKVVVVPLIGRAEAVASALPRAVTLDAFLEAFAPGVPVFDRGPFDRPLYILYSSGTTGVPKCIVHGAGGALLQHVKEHRLNCDLKPGERFFYFTTLGWMMWNWLVSGLASGATLCLYDGSPFHPTKDVLWRYAAEEHLAVFGTSAKFIDGCLKADLAPGRDLDLSALRLVCSTGSPLAPEGFSWVYDRVKADLHLASISGGTDICSCFVLGDPTAPVIKGEIQAPGLGMATDVWSDDGKPVTGEKGELVCTRPFPSMPVMFWNDPTGAKYRAAYFERFPNIWCHGDFAEWTPHGGMIIHGRSDATLNPGGVRIGTAEIYAQVEQIPEVVEAIAVGQDWDNDVRIVLFVRLAAGVMLDEALKKTIAAKIRTGASPRHVPAKIIAIGDIPRTRSGKITELAVRDVIHGRAVKNTEALANPEALMLYEGLEDLKN